MEKHTLMHVRIFASRYPFFFALIFFIISFCLDNAILFFSSVIGTILYQSLIDIILQALFGFMVLFGLGWLSQAGVNRPSRWHNLYLLWLPALLALIYFISALGTPVSSATVLLLALITTALTALEEEIRFRGVLLQSLLPFGPLLAATLSSLFFGLAHLTNIFTHSPLPVVLAQVVGAFLLGFGFAACRLRTGTIWPLILFHALYDLPANMTLFNAKNTQVVISGLAHISVLTLVLVLILPGCILGCYGLFLLRPSIIKRHEEKQMDIVR